MSAAPFCVSTVVSEKALTTILENTGQGTFKDDHPWIIAQERLALAESEGWSMPILFATGNPAEFSHWSFVIAIDVEEFHKGIYETRCDFGPLQPVNPIFTPIDSVCLMPSIEQLRRETVEPIRIHRQFLDDGLIRPYAICETPSYIEAALSPQVESGTEVDS